MTDVTDRTGEELRELLGESGAKAGSVTSPMHAGEGLRIGVIAAGIVASGTADESRTTARVTAPRGWVTVLQSAERAEWDRHYDQLAAALRVLAPTIVVSWTSIPGGDQKTALDGVARELSSVPAAVHVERPPVPQLTGNSLQDARRLFGLTVPALADLFGVTERQMHRYLRDGVPAERRELADSLAAVGLSVIGGLGTDAARRWLYSGSPSPAESVVARDTENLRRRIAALDDSPVT